MAAALSAIALPASLDLNFRVTSKIQLWDMVYILPSAAVVYNKAERSLYDGRGAR